VIAYLDSSVLLRIVLRQSDQLKEWEEIRQGVASRLAEVECLRTLDRLGHGAMMSDNDLALRRETVFRLLAELNVVDVSKVVLSRASEPFPAPLGTLDAIHLATALLWRQQRDEEIVMATHDAALSIAARACGLPVVGI